MTVLAVPEKDRELDLHALAPDSCEPAELVNADARWLAELLARDAIAFVRLAGCRRGARAELLFVEVNVEVPQHCVFDIRSEESLGVVFWRNEQAELVAPTVFALRRDFPVDAPHLLLTQWDYPRSLCVYDVAFRDVRAQWTPPRFMARVRDWLGLTARGELHATDQPLAPLIGNAGGWIVLPNAIRTAAEHVVSDHAARAGSAVRLDIERLPDHAGRLVLVATEPQPEASERRRRVSSADVRFVAAVVSVTAQPHGAIQRAPETVEELHQMLARAGGDLLGALRGSLREWQRADVGLDKRVVLVVLVPRLRDQGLPPESVEALAFLIDKPVRDLGVDIGVWELTATGPGALLLPDLTRTGTSARVDLLYPIFTLTRSDAAKYNGRNASSEQRLTAIGGGSLGSQVIVNALRAGFGRWTLIDEDLLLPHNSARHALPPEAVGLPKASSLAILGNNLTDDDAPVVVGIVADVLNPGSKETAVSAALREADAVIDLSASVTVARALATKLSSETTGQEIELGPRHISIFLNPTGTDLTLLAEDRRRIVRLDSLEMQYYRAILHDERLHGTLRDPSARVRYGRSCRDVSVELPQALAALHGGIAARALERALASSDAQMCVWHVDDPTLGVTPVVLSPVRTRTSKPGGGWTLVTDDYLLQRLVALRASQLPNETGGALIGVVDIAAHIIYVVDTLLSPSDSTELPSSYTRGWAGLTDAVRRVERDTAGQLHYIGEWHSHPDGRACLPSNDDINLFSWLAERLGADGLPPVMLIVGDEGLVVPYVGELPTSTIYPATLHAPLSDGSSFS